MGTLATIERRKDTTHNGITQKDIAQWIKGGKIQHFYVETATNIEQHIEKKWEVSPLAESIKYEHNRNDCAVILRFSDGYTPAIYFGKLEPHKFYNSYMKPGALMAPCLEEKKPTFIEKLLRTVKKPAKQQYTINFGKSDIVINLLSHVGDRGKRSTSYTLGIKCDIDIGNLIAAEACGSELAAFNFFVKIIPGFEQLEGVDFNAYRKHGFECERKDNSFSSANFTTLKDFDDLRDYPGELKIKIS